MTEPNDPYAQRRTNRQARRPQRQPNRAGGPQNQPYGYQGATAYGATLSDPGTSYEQGVLSGKYLTPDSNPYLGKYADEVSRRFQGDLSRGLSQVSSPFLSGATLGQSGIHADVRGRYFNEGQRDLAGELSRLYMGAYDTERGYQQGTSQDISNRTMGLRSNAAQNYGTDVQARTQIQQAKIQAQTTLQQARMAQQFGYDSLAADLMYKYEQLNQQATQMEQNWLLSSGALGTDIMRGFSETNQYGQPMNTAEGITSGILGGGISGGGLYKLWK